jgi:hypothetical protein
MSAPDAARAPRRLPQAPQRYGTIVVVGGGCYGAYYVRQLARAARAGAIVADRVVVVDRDPTCRVARGGWDARPGDPADAPDATGLDARGAPPEHHDGAGTGGAHHHLPALVIELAEWTAFFGAWLGAAAAGEGGAGDAIVPSPLMPHLMYDWLRDRAQARWPGREVVTRPLPRAPSTPWERAAPDGTHYVSFAEWMCPINCIEPERCPHTRGPRSWSLTRAVGDYARALADEGTPVAGPVLLHCAHRAWGVGMFDVAAVLEGDRLVAEAGARGPASVLVGTVSHCHGALNLLHLG